MARKAASTPPDAPAAFDKVPPDELEQIGRGFDAEDAEDATAFAPPAPEPREDERDDDDDQVDDEPAELESSPAKLKMAEGFAHGGWSFLNDAFLKGKRFECTDKEIDQLARCSRRWVAQFMPDDAGGIDSPLVEMLFGAAMVLGPKALKAPPPPKTGAQGSPSPGAAGASQSPTAPEVH